MLAMMMIMGLMTNICSEEKVFNFGGNWKVFHIGSKLHHLLNVLHCLLLYCPHKLLHTALKCKCIRSMYRSRLGV